MLNALLCVCFSVMMNVCNECVGCIYVYLAVYFIYVAFYVSTHLPINLTPYLFLSLIIYLSIYLSTCFFVTSQLPTCLPLYLLLRHFSNTCPSTSLLVSYSPTRIVTSCNLKLDIKKEIPLGTLQKHKSFRLSGVCLVYRGNVFR